MWLAGTRLSLVLACDSRCCYQATQTVQNSTFCSFALFPNCCPTEQPWAPFYGITTVSFRWTAFITLFCMVNQIVNILCLLSPLFINIWQKQDPLGPFLKIYLFSLSRENVVLWHLLFENWHLEMLVQWVQRRRYASGDLLIFRDLCSKVWKWIR